MPSSNFASFAVPPGEANPVYETIPLPPRSRDPRPKGLPRRPSRRRSASGTSAPLAAVPPANRRSAAPRDLVIALLAAVAANLLFVLLFLVVTLKAPLSPGDEFIRVHPAENESARPEELLDGGSKGGATPADLGGRGGGTSAAAFVVTTEAAALALPTAFEASASVEATRETDLHEALLEPTVFGASLSLADFEAAERQHRARAESFAKGRGGRGGQGPGLVVETIAGLFAGSPSADGTGMVVFVDVSGSMKEISAEVAAFLSAQFPKSGFVEIPGCSIRSRSCQFVTQLDRIARRDEHTDFYFICDLQDGQSEAGAAALRASLKRGTLPKSLRVVSFDKRAEQDLQSLIAETGGSFRWIATAWR